MDRAGSRRSQRHGNVRAVKRRPGCARTIGGQLDGVRRVGEAVAPVLHLGLDLIARQPLPLRRGEVRVLEWECRKGVKAQGCGLSAAERLIQRDELAHEDVERESVADQMVQRDGQQMLLRADAIELRAQQPICGDVERPARGILRGGSDGARVEPARVDEVERGAAGARDLTRLAVHLDEARAQHVVPPLHLFERARQRVRVELAKNTHGGGDVVGGACAAQFLEEPETLLRVGEQARSMARGRGIKRDDVRWRGAVVRAAQECDQLGFAGAEGAGQFWRERIARSRKAQVAVVFPELNPLLAQNRDQLGQRVHSVISTCSSEAPAGFRDAAAH